MGLGFRDLEVFNLAMLANQDWNSLCKPQSLCARVLKGIFYHDKEFYNAKYGQVGSWSWKGFRGTK